MNHFVMDAFNGYRSRLDDITLVHEFLEELPAKLGLETVMPPFILPYYNGIIPEDCGISAFVFLEGGHFTIHTFSFREAYFVDLVSPREIDGEKLARIIRDTFPAEKVSSKVFPRGGAAGGLEKQPIDESEDFGPHLFIDFNDYVGPASMDDLFEQFDRIPFHIGMTPIMRPYVMKNNMNGVRSISVLTMIAESHISLHYFPDSKQAYFDLFSCRFFDYKQVINKLDQIFIGEAINTTLMPRGSKYNQYKRTLDPQAINRGSWVDSIYERLDGE